jgi:hypothetical protein
MTRILFRGVFILLFLITFVSCNSNKNSLELPSDTNKAEKLLLEKISVRSSLNDAARIMQKFQFECQIEESKSFKEYQNINFLSCLKQAPQIPFICDSVWQIAIVHKNRVVTDVLVAYGTVCL